MVDDGGDRPAPPVGVERIAGGGAYAVSRENLGEDASLVAASSLLIDYVLTVAVSVVAGVAAITSAAPALAPHAVVLSLAFVALLLVLQGIDWFGPKAPTVDWTVPALALFAYGLATGVAFWVAAARKA